MTLRDPITRLATHDVTNQPPPLADYNLYETDPALKAAVQREGAGWAAAALSGMGAFAGSELAIGLGRSANRYGPELNCFDRFGRRIDEVEFHPAYHQLMAEGIERQVHSIAWLPGGAGGHAAHAALEFLLTQAEAGVCCPITMTYASLPALRQQPDIAAEWEPRILAGSYDPRSLPAAEKTGVTIGMAMTEKQGGSDLRATQTRAEPLGAGGPAAAYELTGHKWFCSAPMSDAFLTLAKAPGGLSCFMVPRWRPDGGRNRIFMQRLKDKLGNRSNASAEIEYDGAFARMLGEEGQGLRVIMEMVQHTRLDAATVSAGMMRQAVVQAVHHAGHRHAFQKRLDQQPLMRNVLADMVIDSEAATILVMRVARAVDQGAGDVKECAFARLSVALAKFWLTKRLPGLVYEAMECLGGNGYVEESMLPRLYREAPVNSIWEGSGNVICLDMLRALRRETGCAEAFLAELDIASGSDRFLDAAIRRLKDQLGGSDVDEANARALAQDMALALQGALLVAHAPAEIAQRFCAARLGEDRGLCYGTLPSGFDMAKVDLDRVIERARVRAAEN